MSRSNPRPLLAVLVALAMSACDNDRPATDASSSPSASAPAPPASMAAPSAAASAPAPDLSTPLELREFTFTSEVKDKEPKDTLLAAEPGKRVWAHLRLRNRSEGARKIHLEFRVNDDVRTTLDLEVARSWSYRTWAYNTMLPSDKKGTVSIRVTDDTGAVLVDTSLPIASKARTKPYEKSGK